MSLPIDLRGGLWFIPKAIWEWEEVPSATPSAETANLAPSAPQSSSEPDAGVPACEGTKRLVFKGYTYEASYHYVFADSPLSRPWLHGEDDNHDVRDRVEPESPTAGAEAARKPGDEGSTV